MEILLAIALLLTVLWTLKNKAQTERIALLGTYLGKYKIEKLMETLIQGYMRALGEAGRRAARADLAHDAHCVSWKWLASLRVSRGTLAGWRQTSHGRPHCPWRTPSPPKSYPKPALMCVPRLPSTRKGLLRTAQDEAQSDKDRAFQMSAQLLLMQHTCHWFCRSKSTASVRMQVRHQTSYAQLLAAVSPQTRQAYLAVLASPLNRLPQALKLSYL
jgi:hypothetical protein